MRNLLRKTHPVANITITQWQNYFESLLNMTGNSPENEAGIDGQESRTEDYYETEIRDMARQKHSGETVISCYKNVTMREKKIERGRGTFDENQVTARQRNRNGDDPKDKRRDRDSKKLCLSSAISGVSLGTSRFVWDTNVCCGTLCFVGGHHVFVWDTNVCCGTLCFVGGHHVFVWDTNIFFRNTMFCLGDKSLLWDIEFCWGITIFCLGHKYLLWDIVFC